MGGKKEVTDGVRGNSVLIIMKLMIKLSKRLARYDPQDNFSLAPVLQIEFY